MRPQTASLPRGFAASCSEPALHPPPHSGGPGGAHFRTKRPFCCFLQHLACGGVGTWACFLRAVPFLGASHASATRGGGPDVRPRLKKSQAAVSAAWRLRSLAES